MPQFTQADQTPGQIGLIEGVPREQSSELGKFNRGRNAILMPDLPETMTELSERDRVFIYNVSPWQSSQSCGSIGTFTVLALDEEKVVENINGGTFHVAGPLTVPGLPYEVYPRDRGEEGKLILHKGRKNRGEKNPGMDLAREIIGNGVRAGVTSNLSLRGVFISPFLAPADKKDPNFSKWARMVKDAIKNMLQYCTEKCQEANAMNARGQFELVRSPELYQMARIIKGTNAQFPWLANVEQATTKSQCPFCQQTIPTKALRCPVCSEQIVSDEEYKAAKDRIKAGTVAA